MLHNPFSTPVPTPGPRPSLQLPGLQSLSQSTDQLRPFSDSRTHGYQGPSRSVTLFNASSAGASAISKSPDGERCVVAGKDSLRILRVSDASEKPVSGHKYTTGRGGFRIDASRNFWSTNGLKVDSAMTDVAWCHKVYDTKILTSARNGELLLWDLHKSGHLKYESKKKAHSRSINKLSYSRVTPQYFSTCSSDGFLRVWDLRSLSKDFIQIHHNFPIRTVLFTPSIVAPFHAFTGLESGAMCCWDLRMGQKGLVERVPLAHTGAVLSLDWNETGESGGWLASAGLDRTVKIWDFTKSQPQSSRKPGYVLHVSYPVRRVTWRPGYETELAIASYNESAYNLTTKTAPSSSVTASSALSELNDGNTHRQNSSVAGSRAEFAQRGTGDAELSAVGVRTQRSGDSIEIWDVRRPWIAKWIVEGSNREGGVSDMTFADSHALWVQHPSGAFSQMDLRYCEKSFDSVPRTALTWGPTGSLTFVSDTVKQWEIPYDDVDRTLETDSAEKSSSHKKLGNELYTPASQTIGTMSDSIDSEDWNTFTFLARSYKMAGADRLTLCELNAETAFEAGSHEAGRIWLLLRSLLTDFVVSKLPTPSLSRRGSIPGPLHSTYPPAIVPTVKRSPNRAEGTRSSSSDPPSQIHQVSAKRSGGLTSTPRALTPSIHSPASPVLTQELASAGNGNQPAVEDDKRQIRSMSMSVSAATRPRKLSLRRSSSSRFSGDRLSSGRKRVARQVGEGALDEDSSDEEVTLSVERPSETTRARASTETVTSSLSKSSWARNHIASSPGLHDDDEWAEDEKEDSDSPNPSSESDNSVASTTAARSNSLGRVSRSRSSRHGSTITSAKPKMQSHEDLPRTDSQSSVMTVVAGGDKLLPQDQPGPPESEGLVETISLAPSHKSKHRHSQRITAATKQPQSNAGNEYGVDEQEMRFLEWNHLAIKDSEDLYRRAAWSALRQVVEDLAEHGDIQLCAMLSCIAPSELAIPPWRALQFVDAYLDILSRFRMHEVLAYIRKYAPLPEVRESTQVQTTVHSACASCRKPLLQRAMGREGGADRSWSGFSQCFDCRKPTIICTICRLPVRSTLFVCAVCSHGGHRECYHRFYAQRPMVELLSRSQESRGRHIRAGPASEGGSASSPSLGGEGSLPDQSIIRVSGHPCAAGCGHYCWTSSEKLPTA